MAAERSTEEYVVQYFGFSAKAFSDSVYNVICDSVDFAIKELNESIDTSFSTNDTDDHQVDFRPSSKLNCENIGTAVLKSAEVVCDKLEIYLANNFFNIPDHVTLPEDHIQLDVELRTSNSKRSLDSQLKRLTNELKTVASKMAQQELDKRRLDSIIRVYEMRLDMIDHISDNLPLDALEAEIIESANDVKHLKSSIENL